VIEPRDPLDRLEHEIAGVECHDDLVIALGAKLLAQELVVARRVLPVDEAAVETRHIFAQGLELGALALLMLGLDPVDRFLHEELQRGAVHAAHIGHDVYGAVDADLPGELDQRQRSAPAYPDAIDVDASPAGGNDRQCNPLLPSGRELAADDLGGLDFPA
jgi:hypothetical protein